MRHLGFFRNQTFIRFVVLVIRRNLICAVGEIDSSQYAIVLKSDANTRAELQADFRVH